jgi:urease accessory protein
MPESSLLPLLHLCDSLFPIGGYVHSDGLEAATSSGAIQTAAGLEAWMRMTLDETLARTDGPAVALAWAAFGSSDWAAIDLLDREVHALRPSSTAREASRAIGSRLIRTWMEIHPDHRLRALADARPQPMTFPVAFGAVCASEDVPLRNALEGFMYARLASVASAAMRLMSIGQGQAHTLLSAMLARVPGVVQHVLDANARPSAFTPAFDIASMSQQYVHSRLFRS